MPKNDIFIQFNTNALQASREVASLDEVLNDIESRGRGVGAGFRSNAASSIQELISAISQAPLGQAAELDIGNIIKPAKAQLLSVVDNIMADTALKRFKSIKDFDFGPVVSSLNDPRASLEEVVNLRSLLFENLGKSTSATSKKIIQQYLDAIDAQTSLISNQTEGSDTLKDKLGQAKIISSLESVRNRFQAIGVNITNIGDLGGVVSQLGTIDTGLAQAVADYQAGAQNLTLQEGVEAVRALANTGLESLRNQIKGFDTQIGTALSTRTGSVVDTLANLYNDRFGNAPVDPSSLSDLTAFSRLRGKFKNPLLSDLTGQLSPSQIPALTALSTARLTGTPADVVSALQVAEQAINDRVSSVRDQLTRLSRLAQLSGDTDFQALVTQIAQRIDQSETGLREFLQKQETAVRSVGLKRITELGNRLQSEISLAAGSLRVNFTPEFQSQFVNTLDEAVFRYAQQSAEAFANTRFRSLGKRSLRQVDPTADPFTTALEGAGFFSATTASARSSSLEKAVNIFEQTVSGLGLSEVEFEAAVKTFRNFAEKIQSQYKVYEGIVDAGLSVQSQRRRTQANLATQRGNYEEARQILMDLGNLTTDRVGTPGAPVTMEGLRPQTPEDMTPRGYSDYLQNLEQNARLEEINRSRQLGPLQRFARFGNTLLAAFGFLQATIGEVLMQFGQLIDQANRLDKTVATVSALTGSFESLSSSLSLAARQQQAFGGTLEENLQGLTSLIPITKRYNVDLGQLDNIARRLAIIDPLQGFSGASIALKEFFSGDITSLSRRFEIDRKTLNSIKAAGNQAAQLKELDRVLTELGISNELLAARTKTTAVEFDRFGSGLSNTQALAGKYLQNFIVDRFDIGNVFNDLTRELVNLTELEQEAISRGAAVANIFEKAANGTITFADGVAQANEEITRLNEVRSQFNEAPLVLLREEDKEVVNRLYELSKASNAPLTDLLAGVDIVGSLRNIEEQRRYARANNQDNALTDFLANVLSLGLYEPQSYASDRRTNQLGAGTSLFPTMFRDNAPFDQNAFDQFVAFTSTLTGRPEGGLTYSGQIRENLQNASVSYITALEASSAQVETLSDVAFGNQTRLLYEQTGINYQEATERLTRRILEGDLTQEEANSILEEQIKLNKQLLEARKQGLIVEQDLITQARASLTSYATNLDQSLTNQLNQITEREAQVAQSTAASLYMAAGGGATRNFDNKAAEAVVVNSEKILGLTREQLYYLGRIQKREALITLERNKSVSAISALTNRYRGLNVTLGETAQLAVGFSEGINNLVSNNLLGQLSIEDQLKFYRNQQTNPAILNNQEAVFSNLTSVLGLLQQGVTKQVDIAKKAADDEKDALERRNKIVEDAEKDKTKLIEEYEKKKLELLKESEISKRESKVSFYEGLFGADNLNQETLRQYSAQYEQFFAEASGFRNMGQFEKAAAVLEAGSSLLLRQIKYEDELMGKREDIKAVDKEIAELKEEYANAETAEDRRSIQEKIDKALIQKKEATERIREIEGLRKLAKDADDEALKQAREREETAKKEFEEGLAERNQALKDALTEADEAYKQSAKDRADQFSSSNKAQIVSFNDLVQLQVAGYSVLNAARIAAQGGGQAAIEAALKGYRDTQAYFSSLGTVAGDEISGALLRLQTILPSINQQYNNSARQITGLGDYLGLSGYNIPDFNPADITELQTTSNKLQQTNNERLQKTVDALGTNSAAINDLNRRMGYYFGTTNP